MDTAMSNPVCVIDTTHTPLTPCKPSVARRLLAARKAAVFRRFPFTIILRKAVDATPRPLTLKIDPGSKTTGFAILDGPRVLFCAELTHRGQTIKAALLARRGLRRGRRQRTTRYRQPRFLNRTRPAGWLPPSLRHRIDTTMTWVERFRRYTPIGSMVMELVKFDMQRLENPDISGIAYQRGTLYDYEEKEYLLEKWQHTCAYCGAHNVPLIVGQLQVEHIQAKARGGTDRVSNLVMACVPCNQRKGSQSVQQFLAHDPDRLARIEAQRKAPLRDAAAVNTTRWALYNTLKALGLPLRTGSGGRTKWNRTRQGLPKTHWVDAACVGEVDTLELHTDTPLRIRATGHGGRQMCVTDKHGFPKYHKPRQKVRFGYQTGDIVRATVSKGKHTGTYIGRAVSRPTPSLEVFTSTGVHIRGVSVTHCTRLHRKDGYAYGEVPKTRPARQAVAVPPAPVPWSPPVQLALWTEE